MSDLITKTHDYKTRQKTDLKVTINNTSTKSPYHFNRCLYNNLPKTVLECASYNEFKTELHQFLLGNTFYKIEEFWDQIK